MGGRWPAAVCFGWSDFLRPVWLSRAARKKGRKMKKRILTKEDIPDAPKGERLCDLPPITIKKGTPEFEKMFPAWAFIERFTKMREPLYDAAKDLTGEERADFLTRALAVQKTTGMPIDRYNLLGGKKEIEVTRIAAKMSKREQNNLIEAMKQAIEELSNQPVTAVIDNLTPAERRVTSAFKEAIKKLGLNPTKKGAIRAAHDWLTEKYPDDYTKEYGDKRMLYDTFQKHLSRAHNKQKTSQPDQQISYEDSVQMSHTCGDGS